MAQKKANEYLFVGLMLVMVAFVFEHWHTYASAIYRNLGALKLAQALITMVPCWPAKGASLEICGDIAPQTLLHASAEELNSSALFEANPRTYHLLGLALALQKQYIPAAQALETATRLAADDRLAFFELGDVYDALNLPDQAVAAYERGSYAGTSNRAVDDYLKIAERYYLPVELGRALHAAQAAVLLDPDNLYARYLLLEATYASGNDTEAANILHQLYHIDFERAASDARLGGYCARGAIALYDAAIWSWDTVNQLAAYMIWQFPDKYGTEMFMQTLSEHISIPAGFAQLNAEWQERLGNMVMAVNLYSVLYENSPEVASTVRLAQAEQAMGNNTQALVWYRLAAQQSPDELYVLEQLGALGQSLGVPEATTWQSQFQARVDDRNIIAGLLGLENAQVDLGENLLKNGSFEDGSAQPAMWIWWTWSSAIGLQDALFLGGTDNLEAVAGEKSLRIQGVWSDADTTKGAAYAGFCFCRNHVSLQPLTPYVLSFFYKTIGESEPLIYMTIETGGMFQEAHDLPSTQGEWRKFEVLGWNRTESAKMVEVLLLNRGVGNVWFDDVTLREIKNAGGIPQLTQDTSQLFYLR